MNKIFLYNSLGGRKEEFKTTHDNEARVYTCGPTVYNFAHIGNLRTYVFEDLLKRTLEYSGYKVLHAMNITDVGHLTGDADEGEDKIDASAKREGKSPLEIAKFYTDKFFSDLEELNILKPDKVLAATEAIPEQIEIIKILEEKGFTYAGEAAIYFNTSKFPDYGKLSGQKVTDKKAGVREEVVLDTDKKNPADFALWFFTKGRYKNHILHWPSPWGEGFPGWHIECSAISRKLLGQPFDIHTGGVDHIGTHHPNEMAQSEAAFNTPLANIWMHGEFLGVEGEKMSKSLGNVFTVSNLKERGVHPLAFRLWLLSGHYRSPMNFTWDSVTGAHKALEKLIFEFDALPEGEADAETIEKFKNLMSDDLDTPRALALFHEAFGLKKSRKTIEEMDRVLGLNISLLSKKTKEDVTEEILEIKKERDIARQEKNWQRSDKLRKEIERDGYILEDKNGESAIRKNLSSLI
jgi:cysteinyl-tRNA synthetase